MDKISVYEDIFKCTREEAIEKANKEAEKEVVNEAYFAFTLSKGIIKTCKPLLNTS